MKDGGFRKASRPISSHLIKPVLNGLSDLLRLPQYPVLGVRAAAPAGVRREGELYTHAQGEGKGGRDASSDGHKSGKNNCLGAFPPCEADHLAARMGPSAPRDRPQGRAAPALTSELQVPPRLLANRDPAPQPYFAAEAKRPSPTASGVASFSYRSERADDGDRPVPEIQGEHLSAREGARFLVPPPSPRRSRPASINATLC